MRDSPAFRLDDVGEVRRLIREVGFGTFVSNTSKGLVASHYPIVLDPAAAPDELAILTHVGRPDERLHELGQHEILLIVMGPHGYISPGWYPSEPSVPTWNFVVAHLHGVPEVLSAAENLVVLGDLVDHFEDRMLEPRRMKGTLENAEYAARISAGTVGFRLTATRFEAKSKLSQNKSPETVERVIRELAEGESFYRHPALAAEMRRAHPLPTDGSGGPGEADGPGEAGAPGAVGAPGEAGVLGEAGV
ncbi:MAG: transcriptional regulator [Subtercola sp.]|nr:transcriptional regulator [Subtercola sp.]